MSNTKRPSHTHSHKYMLSVEDALARILKMVSVLEPVQIPILVDTKFQGRTRKLMLWPNRNAFYYVLDRVTGEFLLAKPFAKQTWNDGIDKNGRPLIKTEMFPSKEGTLVYPAVTGAMNWRSPSYSPITDLIYVPALERGNILVVMGKTADLQKLPQN